jgi:hypothetical protein
MHRIYLSSNQGSFKDRIFIVVSIMFEYFKDGILACLALSFVLIHDLVQERFNGIAEIFLWEALIGNIFETHEKIESELGLLDIYLNRGALLHLA